MFDQVPTQSDQAIHSHELLFARAIFGRISLVVIWSNWVGDANIWDGLGLV